MTLYQPAGPVMTDLRTELATLIASRICHDLISPVGAISNGLELVALGGGMSGGPELQLITESCENANARIRFFRVAYGAASETATMATSEIKSILNDLTKGSRLNVTWAITKDVTRAEAQLAFLGLQCLETALRRGGSVVITATSQGLTLEAQADHISCDPALWRHLEGHVSSTPIVGSAKDVAPAHVQFLLLPLLTAERPHRTQVRQKPGMLAIDL